MGRILAVIVVVMAVSLSACSGYASVLFSDDFTGTAIDTSKWSVESGYGSVSQNNEAIFTILGSNKHLKSSTITVPTNVSEVVLSGLWRFADTTYTAAGNISVYDAADPSRYIKVEYGTWDGALIFTDTTGGAIASYARTVNNANLPFAFHFTDSGWTYEEGGSVLRDITSDFTDGVDDFYIKIGGWDYSYIDDQIVYFDNIKVEATSATPEPATMSLLGLGFAGLLRFRKKTKK